ncbi:BadF/BadG/BcrA/BcrD ATPase family protein [Devosia algicola]|uniref:BadF/BadG/BcrA/BcrD ATPase family protein n=1 Tax=Devosia algicola TaxID=3026418 RepID=A0ABY7YMF0_9HYPH|nr:BadF/BadG/BcrA/BcrD ATPase family protein [Devosia algicola]WDR02481.1 BadF/BadG/BcrA/BcrD ATPase family protein [Devosia algicola]
MPRYYLGVDGGGTNCRVRLANENLETLAEVRNGRSNLQIDDGNPAYAAISAGTREVFEKAGLDYAATASTHACFGMAGGRLISAREEFATRNWPFAQVRVYDDIDIAHAGALGGEDGAVIIVGTGSAGLAIIDGQRHQIGGWGFEIGDQMSGAILGRELVRIAVEAADGLAHESALTKAVIAKLGGNNDAVMDWSFDDNRNPADYGALMPMFIDYYQQGDAVAIKLMELQLTYIDAYANWFKARGAKVMAIVGGFGQALFPLLEKRYGSFVVMPKFEPLHGALILAKQNFAPA